MPHIAEAKKRRRRKGNGRALYFDQFGGGNGKSFDSPAALEDLDSLIRDVGKGGVVYGLAGNYEAFKLKIRHGGARVVFVKRNKRPGVGRIIGDRTKWTKPDNPERITDVSDWNDGPNFIELRSGAGGLTFEGFQLERIRNGFYAKASLTGTSLVRCGGYNIQRFFDHPNSVSLKKTRFSNIRVIGFSKQCIRVRGNSSDWAINNFWLDSSRQDRDNFAKGIAIQGTAHGLKIANGVIQNCHSTIGSYFNGDGISSENQTHDISIEDVTCSGHTDGGFDLKSIGGVSLLRCNAFSNKKNYRFWDAHYNMRDCVSGSVKKRGGGGNTGHITTYSSARAPSVQINGLIVVEEGKGNVFMHGTNGSHIEVSGHSLSLSRNARLEKFEGGSSGTLILS